MGELFKRLGLLNQISLIIVLVVFLGVCVMLVVMEPVAVDPRHPKHVVVEP